MHKLIRALEVGGVLVFSAGGLDVPDGGVCRHLEFDQYPQKHFFVIVQRAA